MCISIWHVYHSFMIEPHRLLRLIHLNRTAPKWYNKWFFFVCTYHPPCITKYHCGLYFLSICLLVRLSVISMSDSWSPYYFAAFSISYTWCVHLLWVIGYRNWPWYRLRWNGWCSYPAQLSCGCACWHNECCAGWQYQPRQHRSYKWSISILP